MGWAAGSRLMMGVIKAAEGTSGRGKFYKDVIKEFEAFDCDTLDECFGISDDFDIAYGELYPFHGGHRAAIKGHSKAECPYGPRTKKGKEWIAGWKEAKEDLGE